MNIDITEYIPYGRKNAVSRHELQRRTGLPDRTVRALIEDARRKGAHILSSSADKGYWKSNNVGEIKEFLRESDGKWHGCSFDWILKPANWQKITEGNYENKNYPIRQVESGDREPSYDLDEYMNNALHTSISYQKRGEENE